MKTAPTPSAKTTAPGRTSVAALQRRHSFGAHASVLHTEALGGAPLAVRNSLAAPGHPLDANVRRGMEARFGRDFSGVRVHSDGKSARAAKALGAHAFTIGHDIAFDEGRYDVSTPRGLGTLAHELTHVAQQSGRTANAADPVVVDESPTAEAVAERNASRIQSGGSQIGFEIGPAVAHAGFQRQQAHGATQQPTQTPDEEEQRAAAWEEARVHVIPELLIKFQEIGRVVAVDARKSINETFKPYEDAISTPNQTFLSIFLGGAGNVPQGELGGFLGGAGAAGMQAIIAAVLDTTSVAEVKENARTIPDDVLAENLTTSSQYYQDFENGALGELRTDFDSMFDGHHGSPSELRINDRILQHTARMRYGASSEQGQRVRSALRKLVDHGMVPIKEKLDDAQEAFRRRRNLNIGVSVGAGVGLLAGGIIGGFVGGGAAGVAIGGLIGGLAGGGAGLGIAAIANAFRTSPSERRARDAKRKPVPTP